MKSCDSSYGHAASKSDGTRQIRPLCKRHGVASALSYARANSKAKGACSQRNSPIPSNRDVDEVAFPGNPQMLAEQRKLPGGSKYLGVL